jgi:hypothetical protein
MITALDFWRTSMACQREAGLSPRLWFRSFRRALRAALHGIYLGSGRTRKRVARPLWTRLDAIKQQRRGS